MDKSILKRSVLVIGLVALIALMGCGDCPPGKLCCGGEECGDASEGKSCCGSLCPCTGTASKCCTSAPGVKTNGVCCNPSGQHCAVRIQSENPSEQYNEWYCAPCGTGQKLCGPVCIGVNTCCTDGVVGCGSQVSCYDCVNGQCVEKTGACRYNAGGCTIAPSTDKCADVTSCGSCIISGFPCPIGGGTYGCGW